MSSTKKYFIITAGPTGSGKTKLVKATLKYLGLPEDSSYKKFLIDDLVENDPDYKEEVTKIIDEVKTECHQEKSCLPEAFNKPSPELYDKFWNAYSAVRFGKPLNNNESAGCRNMRGEGINCGDILDNRLEHIKDDKPKIVVFETMLIKIPEWLFDRKFIPENYEVVVTYSLVSIHNLVQRNKSRAYNSVVKFISNPKTPAPRLPNVGKDEFVEKVTTIKNVLVDLYNSCVQSRDDKKCGSVKIDRFLLFDNNGEFHKNIFDSKPALDLTQIDKIFGLHDYTESKKRKSHRKKIKQRKSKKYSKL